MLMNVCMTLFGRAGYRKSEATFNSRGTAGRKKPHHIVDNIAGRMGMTLKNCSAQWVIVTCDEGLWHLWRWYTLAQALSAACRIRLLHAQFSTTQTAEQTEQLDLAHVVAHPLAVGRWLQRIQPIFIGLHIPKLNVCVRY